MDRRIDTEYFSRATVSLVSCTHTCISVEICEDIISILNDADNPDENFRLWVTTENNKVIKCSTNNIFNVARKK